MDQKSDRPKYRSIDGFLKYTGQNQPRQRRMVNRTNDQPNLSSKSQTMPSMSQPKLDQQPFRKYYSPFASKLEQKSQLSPKTKTRWSLKKKVGLGFLALIIVGIGLGSWYGSDILRNIDKILHGNIISDVQALFSNTKLKGENQGRVNILLGGDSIGDPNHGGAQLIDSIMVVSIDTKNHNAFLLSIPRDTWVDIPGKGHQKINSAGNDTTFSQAGYPSGGMGQLEQIIQTDFGIPIDYYALINYTAFKDTVNAVGGITINIQSPDPRGLYDPNINKTDGGPLKLPNGQVTLNGQTALNLARARGDPCYCGHLAYGFPQSDFNRTQHQRQMLSALAQKTKSLGVLANPLRVSQLFNALGNNIQTDFSLQDVLRFVQITKGINISNLQSLSLSSSGPNALLKDYMAPDGQDALIPAAGIDNFSQIKQYYQQLTSADPVVREASTIAVLNASDVVGLAHKEAVILQSKGFQIISMANASRLYPGSLIIDLSDNQKPASKQLLQKLFAKSALTSNLTGSNEAAEAQGYRLILLSS
ncbi:MAG TPA: LCP family protein [Candidatus Dormibacteraeota bacterium]|nr:LCP family protein [Candidatus Dormibacteraeota bacterium]